MNLVGWFDAGCGEHIVDQHAVPRRIELRPFGDAVNVADLMRLRQSVELGPAPFGYRFGTNLEREGPVIRADMRRRPFGENGKVGGGRLARRQPLGDVRRLLPSGKSARDHWLGSPFADFSLSC